MYQAGKEVAGLVALNDLVGGDGEVAGEEHSVDGVDHTIGSQNVGPNDVGAAVENNSGVHLIR
jgi:hypothetical protein